MIYRKTSGIFFFTAHTITAHSSSVVLQFFSFGTVDLLKTPIGRVMPSLWSCSITALNTSPDASVVN